MSTIISSVSGPTGPSASAANFTVPPRKTGSPPPAAPAASASPSASAEASSSTSGTTSTASTSSSQQTIEILQQEMMLYTQFADGGGPAAAHFKALQTAIETKNVSDAQSAMAQLQRDSASAAPPSLVTANSTFPVTGNVSTSAAISELGTDSLNVTA